MSKPRKAALATLKPSPARRFMGVTLLAALGLILLFTGYETFQMSLAGYALAGVGVLVLWAANRVRVSTQDSLELRETGLYSTDGSIVAEIGNVAQVELSLFALRPSGGFLIVLKSPMPKSWNPGLWWRLGRRVGIGGVTPRAEGKAMADAMATLVHKRNSTTV